MDAIWVRETIAWATCSIILINVLMGMVVWWMYHKIVQARVQARNDVFEGNVTKDYHYKQIIVSALYRAAYDKKGKLSDEDLHTAYAYYTNEVFNDPSLISENAKRFIYDQLKAELFRLRVIQGRVLSEFTDMQVYL